ncbi:MAG: DUF1961 family protein [Candidatus Firestonebacteria bacterium]|nr:DUF1961 family protein [Candidatus Firestonebacteria bacterium]
MKAAGKPVLEDSFDKDMSNWVPEGGQSVEVKEGELVIKTKDSSKTGQYVWFKKDLPSNFRVEYDVTPVSKSGFFLINFCTKGKDGVDILDDKLMKQYKALKDFKKYTIGPINCYHISYRRNEQADCNLRKNTGKNLLSNSKVESVIPAQKKSHVILTKDGGHITLIVNGELFMDYTDDGKINGGVYGEGKFGFRQVYESEGRYDNFKVYDLSK